MSGAFGSSQWMYNAGGGFYGTEIDGSLRFNDDDSAYLSRTPASSSNRTTWTWSAWFKRSNLVTSQLLFAGTYTQPYTNISVSNTGQLQWDEIVSGSGVVGRKYSNFLLRDVSSWYHIVCVWDTTNATSSDRQRIYINGVRQTSWSLNTEPSSSASSQLNLNTIHTMGIYPGYNANKFDGYLAEVNLIDGQALDASYFGETKSGIWIPKAYSGSYGTNGFHLEFAGNANDTSGNGNNWTANNISSYDYVPDSPTNNFPTLMSHSGSGNLYQGGLQHTHSSTGTWQSRQAGFGITSGKWYMEVTCGNGGGSIGAIYGFRRPSDTTLGSAYAGLYNNSVSFQKYIEGTATGISGTPTTNAVLGFALDADSSSISVYQNNSLLFTSSFTATDEPLIPVSDIFVNSTNANRTWNFGQDSSFAGLKIAQGNTDENGIGDFYYTPPSGYLALCSANLPAPAIDPAADATPEDNFNTVLYTGNGTSQSITGVGFQPDWTWIKTRNTTEWHSLQDSVRGVTRTLFSNEYATESTLTNRITSFNADGFSIGNNNNVNSSGNTHVAWNWKAGGTASSNTNGTITSTVSANQDAGFSIVNYVGNGSTCNWGHGLSQEPELIIFKRRPAAQNWFVFHKTTGSWRRFEGLNNNLTDSDYSPYMSATSTTVTLPNNAEFNTSGDNMIAYCFNSSDGNSKVGRYTGNGSTDGSFIYTGFRCAFVMVKRTDSNGNWVMFDNTRSPYNNADNVVSADLSDREYTSSDGVVGYDFVSNGFKCRDSHSTRNASGGTYIYIAFAEQPFKYANAR